MILGRVIACMEATYKKAMTVFSPSLSRSYLSSLDVS